MRKYTCRLIEKISPFFRDMLLHECSPEVAAMQSNFIFLVMAFQELDNLSLNISWQHANLN